MTTSGVLLHDSVLPRRRADIREYVCDGETVLFDPTTWQTCVLNSTAYDVWKGCDGQSTMAQVANEQARAYEVEADEALDHVEQVVEMFASLTLFDLEAADAPASNKS